VIVVGMIGQDWLELLKMTNAQMAQKRLKISVLRRMSNFDNFNPDLVAFVKLIPHLENQSNVAEFFRNLVLKIVQRRHHKS